MAGVGFDPFSFLLSTSFQNLKQGEERASGMCQFMIWSRARKRRLQWHTTTTIDRTLTFFESLDLTFGHGLGLKSIQLLLLFADRICHGCFPLLTICGSYCSLGISSDS